MGGPNGGDGGNGGNAYLYGDPSYNTLLHLKFNSTMYGESGQIFTRAWMIGAQGNQVATARLIKCLDSFLLNPEDFFKLRANWLLSGLFLTCSRTKGVK